MIFSRKRYYFVSYAHEKGFGSIFFWASPYLDIGDAVKQIKKTSGKKHVIIIAINRINKHQFEKKK